MRKISIECASANDIMAIENLECEYGKEIYSQKEIEKMLNMPIYKIFVAKDENDFVIAYLCATCIFEDCELLKIIVSQNYRNCGVGKLLLEKLIDVAKKSGCTNITLEVRNSNDVAISFYEKNGFRFEYKRDKYYGNEDAKIYRLSLS